MVAALEQKREQFKSKVRLRLADVPQRRQFVHDKTEVHAHRHVLVADVRHGSALLAPGTVRRVSSRRLPAATARPVPQAIEQHPNAAVIGGRGTALS